MVVLLKNSYSFVSQRSTGVQQSPAVALFLATQIDSGPAQPVQPVHHQVHSPQPTTHSPQPKSPPSSTPTAQSTTSNQSFRNAPLPNFIFSHVSHHPSRRIPYIPYIPYTPYTIQSSPITLSWPSNNSSQFNSFCFSLSSAFAFAAHCRLSPIYLTLLYPLALLSTHCTYLHTTLKIASHQALKYGLNSRTRTPPWCVWSVLLSRDCLSLVSPTVNPNPPPATTTSSPASNVAQLSPFALERYR